MTDETLEIEEGAHTGRAHTRPGVSARDPLIYWTVARWRPPDGDRDAWASRVNGYSKAMAVNIGLSPYAAAPKIPGIPEGGATTPHRYLELNHGPTAHRLTDIVTYDFQWWSAHARLRFELHTEYWIEELTLDFSEPAALRFPDDPRVKAIEDDFAALGRLLMSETPTRAKPNATPERYGRFSRRMLSELPTYARDQRIMCVNDPARYGDIFADLRGLVLGEVVRHAANPFDAAVNGRVRARPAFWRDANARRNRDAVARIPSAADWEEKIRRLWPFVSAPIAKDDALTDFEYSVSTLLEGRALHVSALGAAHPARPNQASRPVYSWFLIHGLGGWATARLVDAMCEQGVLRLAAIHQYETLYRVADRLRDAEQELIRAATLDGVEELSASLQTVQATVSDGDALLPDGGVGHRVQRSRYYVAKFFAGLPRLQIATVGDYQSYESFLRATMGAAFSFIEVLGARYERVRRDERLLVEQLRNARLLEIQRLGDLALLIALLPYYVGMVVSHAVSWPTDHHEAPGTFWFMCVFVGAAGAFIRLEPASPPRVTIDRTARRKRVSEHCLVLSTAYMSIFFATTLAILLVAGLIENPWRHWLGLDDPSVNRVAPRLLGLGALPVVAAWAALWPGQRWLALERDMNAGLRPNARTDRPSQNESRVYVRPYPKLWIRAAGLVAITLVLASFFGMPPATKPHWVRAPDEKDNAMQIGVTVNSPRLADTPHVMAVKKAR